MEDYNQLYPNISGESFRLQKTNEALNTLEKELKHYTHVRKKYKRVQSTFSKLSMGMGILSVTLGSSGLGLSLSGLGLPVGISLGSLAGVFGLVSVGCASVAKRLSRNVSKHDQTVATARSKVYTIREMVSKAMTDNKISDEEFSLIMKELEKFDSLKQTIRQSIKRKEPLMTDEKNMSKIREEVRAEILKDISKKA